MDAKQLHRWVGGVAVILMVLVAFLLTQHQEYEMAMPDAAIPDAPVIPMLDAPKQRPKPMPPLQRSVVLPGDDMPMVTPKRSRVSIQPKADTEGMRQKKSINSTPEKQPMVQDRPAPARLHRPEKKAPPALVAKQPQQQNATLQWWVQLSSYHARNKALRFYRQIKAAGYAVRIQAAEVKGKAVYRIQVGPLADKPAAQGLRTELSRRFQVKALLFSSRSGT